MKNIIKFCFPSAVVLILAGWFYSCNKMPKRDEINARAQNLANMLGITDSGVAYKTVIVSDDQHISASDSNHRVSMAATFIDSASGNAANITGLSINGQSFSRKPDSSFAYSYSDSITGLPTLSQGQSMAGTTVNIKVTGATAADTVTAAVYMPKTVVRYVSDWPIMYFNVLNNQTVTWLPDPSSPWGQVKITLLYSAEYSRYLTGDNTLPATDKVLTYTVPDNGSYTIPTADLQGFRAKSFVWLSIGRGNVVKAVLPVSNQNIYFFAAASGSTNAMYVQCEANWQNTTTPIRCKAGSTTGEQEQEQRDLSVCSVTYNQTRWVAAGTASTCITCNTGNCTGNKHKCINGVCVTGTLQVVYKKSGPNCLATYTYLFPDGTIVPDHQQTFPGSCPLPPQ